MKRKKNKIFVTNTEYMIPVFPDGGIAIVGVSYLHRMEFLCIVVSLRLGHEKGLSYIFASMYSSLSSSVSRFDTASDPSKRLSISLKHGPFWQFTMVSALVPSIVGYIQFHRLHNEAVQYGVMYLDFLAFFPSP